MSVNEPCEITEDIGAESFPCPYTAISLILAVCPEGHIGCHAVCVEHLTGFEDVSCLNCYTEGRDSDLQAIEVTR